MAKYVILFPSIGFRVISQLLKNNQILYFRHILGLHLNNIYNWYYHLKYRIILQFSLALLGIKIIPQGKSLCREDKLFSGKNTEFSTYTNFSQDIIITVAFIKIIVVEKSSKLLSLRQIKNTKTCSIFYKQTSNLKSRNKIQNLE